MPQSFQYNLTQMSEQDFDEKIHASLLGDPNITLSCTFSEYEHSRWVRSSIRDILNNAGLEHKWVHRFSMVVDELMNNAIEHGSCNFGKNIITFRCEPHESICLIIIEVRDSGKGNKHPKALDIQNIQKQKAKAQTYLQQRGRGLFLMIQKIVDSLEFEDNEDGGLTVRIKKTIDMHTNNAPEKNI